MRITYTRDHNQCAFIIQIVIPDEDIIPLPLAINLAQTTRGSFFKLSEHLRNLATVAEVLESPPEEEENEDFMTGILDEIEDPEDPILEPELEEEGEEEEEEEEKDLEKVLNDLAEAMEDLEEDPDEDEIEDEDE